jgi:hypothetical protein
VERIQGMDQSARNAFLNRVNQKLANPCAFEKTRGDDDPIGPSTKPTKPTKPTKIY